MVDTEKLINEISLRHPIWDQTNLLHHNRDVVSKQWQEVATLCGVTIEAAKTRWKNLRDHFRAQWKRSLKQKSDGVQTQSESNWVWFKHLIFLKDQMSTKKRGPISFAQTENLHATQEQVDADDQSLSISTNQSTNFKKRKTNPIEDDDDALRKTNDKIRVVDSNVSQSTHQTSDDDLYHFLMSLYKPLSDLSVEKQMFIRIKIQELIYNQMIDVNQSTINYVRYLKSESMSPDHSIESTCNSNDFKNSE
ncbi:hypothetical protein FQR65_LT05886 [Abscondita terminalis]|nr:hypothetical protein FQR65_LT05886 [Abscondita terminalis]